MQSVEKYIPSAALKQVEELLLKYPHQLKIVNKRLTKHGDFRRSIEGKFTITINNSLNKYQFLLTLIHEIAHLVTFLNYKNVKPHGIEWKMTFRDLMLPFLSPTIFPNDILPHLAKYLMNPKASTDSDVNLSLAMKKHSIKSDKNFIFEIPFGADFYYKNRRFKKGNKRRTRYECQEIRTKKIYLFNSNAEVEYLVRKL